MLVLLAVAAVGATLPVASAAPALCDERSTSTGAGTGTWSTDCTGVDDAHCVGKWGASGTWQSSGGGTMYRTTAQYRSVACPAALPSGVDVFGHRVGADGLQGLLLK
jgi:hypothetical protein